MTKLLVIAFVSGCITGVLTLTSSLVMADDIQLSGTCSRCSSEGAYCVPSASGWTGCTFENGKCKVFGSPCGKTGN